MERRRSEAELDRATEYTASVNGESLAPFYAQRWINDIAGGEAVRADAV